MAVTEPINQRCIDQLNREEVEAALEIARLNLSRLMAKQSQLELAQTDLHELFAVDDLLESTLRDGCYYIVTAVDNHELTTMMIHTDPTHIEVYPNWKINFRDIVGHNHSALQKVAWFDVQLPITQAVAAANRFYQTFVRLERK